MRRTGKALVASRSITELSLPIEYSITGFSAWATTSRRMWIDSRRRRRPRHVETLEPVPARQLELNEIGVCGHGSTYEPPERPEVRIDTSALTAEEAAAAVLRELRRRHVI